MDSDVERPRLAIMQPYLFPYLFPYLGYFQLMHAVDTLVLYDDVTYIKRGWINRNRLLVNGAPWLFTLPLANASQNVLIKDLRLADGIAAWRTKWLKTVAHAYAKAPHYAETRALIEPLLHQTSAWLIDWLDTSLRALATTLGLPTRLKRTSADALPLSEAADAQARILARCAQEGAKTYINASNGRALYQSAAFIERGIALRFLQSCAPEYAQFATPFVPHLSIVDSLMFAGIEGTRERLPHYELLP